MHGSGHCIEGGYGELVEEPGQSAPAIQHVIDSGLLACVSFMIDQKISSGNMDGTT